MFVCMYAKYMYQLCNLEFTGKALGGRPGTKIKEIVTEAFSFDQTHVTTLRRELPRLIMGLA
jgi:hypothetical protein